jgi:modification methylase
MARFPDKCVDMIFADPPYNLQLGGDLFRPEGGESMRSMMIGTSSIACHIRRFHPRLARAGARRFLKDDGHDLGDRQLSQHLSGVGALLQDADFWILNDCRLAQDQPDAELPRAPPSPMPTRL